MDPGSGAGMEGMDPGSGAGMTGEGGGWRWVTMKRWHYKCRPPLDPSTRLRVSGHTPPWDGFLPTQDDGGRGWVALGNHEALALQCRPPLDPSTRLRVSGHTPPWDGFLPTQDDGEGAVGEGREGVWVSRWGGGVWRCGARIRRIRRPAIGAPRGRAFLRRVLRGCEPVCPGCRRAI